MLRTDNTWPPEIDIFERFPADASTVVRCTTHTRVATTGFIDLGPLGFETGDHYQSSTVVNLPFDTSTGYHTYGVEWTPTTITYYIDRVQVAQTVTPTDMNKPMYLIANCAVDWQHNLSSFPCKYTIDWVRAWAYPS
jgi:beta-glucanase (GH16 family)